MLRNARKVSEAAAVVALRCPKMISKCTFSTVVSQGRSKVSFIRNECKTSHKQFVRYIRGPSGYRPRISEFQEENQEMATPRRKNEEYDSGRRDETRRRAYEPRRQSYESEPRQRSYEPETSRQSYESEPRRRSYESEPRQRSYEPETSRQSYESEPRRRSYEPEPRRRSYESEPRRRSYESEPRQRSYEPETSRRSYEPEPRQRSYEPETSQQSYERESRGGIPESDGRPPLVSGSKSVKELLQNSTSFSEMAPKDSPVRDWTTSAYPKAETRRLQASNSVRPTIDPKETCIILFPGQGVQYPGMGKNLLKYPNVKRIYEHASEILGYDLLDICLKGTKEELSKTVYCQPAVVVTSLAAVEKLRDEAPHAIDSCIGVAGFSVGELTALMFAGALSFTDGMKLVRIRAEAMQGASEMVAGGMMTVFYGADARINFACFAAKEWCKKKGLLDAQCGVANYLYPGCKVLAGNEEALKFITTNAKDFGIRRMKRLHVSGAFHTRLMLPAQEVLQAAIKSIPVNDPVISVHSNVDGKRYKGARHIQKQLPKQISSAVKWEQTLHVLYERDVGTNFPRTFECGPGKSMKTLLEKVNAKAHGYATCVDVEDMY